MKVFFSSYASSSHSLVFVMVVAVAFYISRAGLNGVVDDAVSMCRSILGKLTRFALSGAFH